MNTTTKPEPKKAPRWMRAPEFMDVSGLQKWQLQYRRDKHWIYGVHWKFTGPREISYNAEAIENFDYFEALNDERSNRSGGDLPPRH